MINKIEVQNFKLFKDKATFTSLKNLNFLTGINGRGKSSFLQVLLTMAQSVKANERASDLLLNGEYVSLGNATDVKNEEVSRTDDTVLSFQVGNVTLNYHFGIDDDNSQVLTQKKIACNGISGGKKESMKFLNNFVPDEDAFKAVGLNRLFRNISYISAERLGPQLSYTYHPDDMEVGADGKYVACALYNHRDDKVNDDFIDSIEDVFPELNQDEIDRSIIGQVNFWLTEMFGTTGIASKYIDDANIYTLQFSTRDAAGNFKPTNVGFGYSYALPILVSGLITMQQKGILIIENPEAHLHPQAQSIIGKFLTLVSEQGVQVFVETHSEHIINAPRVLIAQDVYDAKDLKIMYFDDSYASYYKDINVDEDGKIEKWPKGFFDQAELDSNIILGI